MTKKQMIMTPILIVVAISAIIGGYFVWLELSYQTAEAEAVIEEALLHLDAANYNAELIIDTFSSISQVTKDPNPSDDKYMLTRDGVYQMHDEISIASAASTNLKSEIIAYQNLLHEAEDYKLKDDYLAYIEDLYEPVEILTGMAEASQSYCVTLNSVADLYGTNVELIERYENIELSSNPVTLHNQATQMQIEINIFIGQAGNLSSVGLLDQQVAESNQYLADCTAKIVAMTSTIVTYDYYGFLRAADDFDANCSDASWETNMKKWEQGWKESLDAYFANALSDMEAKYNDVFNSRKYAEDYYKESIT